MPIGKNSIKRVANNGYSNVKTSAPDMENSVELKEEKKPAAATRVKKTTAKAAPKSPEKKSAVLEKAEASAIANAKVRVADKKAPPKKQPQKAEQVKPAPEANTAEIKEDAIGEYVNVGRDMPVYLL